MTIVNIMNSQRKVRLPADAKKLVKAAVLETLKSEDIFFDCEVTVKFVSDDKIRELNRTYRNVNEPTDVLSFPSGVFDEGMECEEPVYIGDIAISLEFAKRQAEAGERTLEHDIVLLTAHSTLHLLGYDHDTKDAEESMFRSQEEITGRVFGDKVQ